MTDHEKSDTRTVAEAVAARAEELNHLFNWARRRIDQAAALVAAATEPYRPDTDEFLLLYAVEAIDLAENIADDLADPLGDASSGSAVCGMVEKAKVLWAKIAESKGDLSVWDPDGDSNIDGIRGWTVEKLAECLAEKHDKTPVTA